MKQRGASAPAVIVFVLLSGSFLAALAVPRAQSGTPPTGSCPVGTTCATTPPGGLPAGDGGGSSVLVRHVMGIPQVLSYPPAPPIQQLEFEPVSTGTHEVNTTIAGPSGPPSTVQTATGDPPVVEVTHNVIVPVGVSTPGVPSANVGSTPEPAVAANGSVVFNVANWMAAFSSNAGKTWGYFDPSKDISGAPQSFCCDQDVLFDVNHGVFIWYRQASTSPNVFTRDSITIFDSKMNAVCEWFIRPDDFKASWNGTWLDYPHIATDVNNFFLTTNRFDTNNQLVDTVIARFSIAEMVACGNSLGFTWHDHLPPISSAMTSFAPVDNAYKGTTIYYATHDDNWHLTLYAWDDSSPDPGVTVHPIPAFTAFGKGATCTDPAGGNACGRADDRILGGWIGSGGANFFWNAAPTGNAPFLYTYIITVNSSSVSPIRHIDVWSNQFAMVFASVALNYQKDEPGMSVLVAGGSNPLARYPTVALGTPASGLSWLVPVVGTGGPSGPGGGNPDCPPNCGGDYLRVKPYYGLGTGISWIASAYSFQGGDSFKNIQLRYYVFQPIGRMDFDISVKPASSFVSPGGALLPAATVTVHRLSNAHIVPVAIDVSTFPPNIATTDDNVNNCLDMTMPSCDTILLIATSPNATFGQHQLAITGKAVGDGNIAWTFFTLNIVANPGGLTPGSTQKFAVNFAGLSSVVAFHGNASIGGISFNPSLRSLTFNVTGPTGSIGNLRVDVPRGLLSGTPKVLVDGNPTAFLLLQNLTDYFVYFQMHLSDHNVVIASSAPLNPTSTSMTGASSNPYASIPEQDYWVIAAAAVGVVVVAAALVVLKRGK